MKALASLLLLASMALATARPVTFAWDPNPAEEMIEGYRIERFDFALLSWVSMGNTDGLTHSLTVGDFPELTTRVRAIAFNYAGEGPPSAELVIPMLPTQPKGMRIVISANSVRVQHSEPGRFITIQKSADLIEWKAIASGRDFVTVSVFKAPSAFFRAVTSS